MGRKLTERQKAERAAKAAVKKQQKALGPLFADQAVAPDVDVLLMQRRLKFAWLVEKNQEHMDSMYILDKLHEQQLRELAGRHIPAEVVARLHLYRMETFPEAAGVSFWCNVLSGKKYVFGYKVVGQKQTPYGLMNQVVEDGSWPPEGWTPPFTREQLRHWQRCKKCGYWHSPEQEECDIVLEVRSL